MLATLLESKSQRERSVAQLIVSIGAHTAIIGAALYATAAAHPKEAPPRKIEFPLVYQPLPAGRSATSTANKGPTRNPLSPDAWQTLARNLSVDIAGIRIAAPPLDRIGPSGNPLSNLPRGLGVRDSARAYGGEAMRADQVERQAAVVPGNPPPRYPEALLASGVEGQVVATFVISPEGRYEEGTLRFVRSDNPLFERAVQSALPRMRFIPAATGGRNVRQLVEMPFVFTLQR